MINLKKITHNIHMKKTISLCLICVFFICCLNLKAVYAFENTEINFLFNNQIYTYSLNNNLKNSTEFDLNYEINKYNRFGSSEDKKQLLKTMLNAGFDEEIALNYIFPNLYKTLNKIEKNINKKPQNAVLKINANHEKVFIINPEKYGIFVDRLKIYNALSNNILNDKKLEIIIPTIKINPQINEEFYKGFTNLRSDFSTDITSSSKDRKHNIKNAINRLNLVEVLPNQMFSFNKIIGKRTEQNGYRNAKIIVNNEFVDGVGGGVCQVSSTLYNAALYAGMEILEANKHSKQVGYVKPGFDAMVNFGSSDLKFRNNTNQKIIIVANYLPNKIRIRLFGEDLGNVKYKLRNEVFNFQEPIEEEFVDTNQQYVDKVIYKDEYFYLKKAERGLEIKTFRETYVNNQLINSELLRHDKFKVQNAIKVYGIVEREKKTEITPSFLWSFTHRVDYI